MGSKNSKNFNQEAIDMLKNGNLNNFDINRLLNNVPNLHYQHHSLNVVGGANYHNGGNNPMNYPPKPPRQTGEQNILMTGSLGGSRIPVINNDVSSKGQLNYRHQNKYDSAGNLAYENQTKINTIYNGASTPTKKEVQTSSASSALPTKSTLLQELLECPICMNLFDNPHVLPCQHTFCKKCIVSLQNSDANRNKLTTIDCPICREKHTLTNGVESLTANYTMKRLIELDAMAASEKEKQLAKEKEKEKENEKEKTKEVVKQQYKAKCFSCQRFAYLKVCEHCSYMLCIQCTENPDHDVIIESKINSKKYFSHSKQPTRASFRTQRHESCHFKPVDDYPPVRKDIYSSKINQPLLHSQPLIPVPGPVPQQYHTKQSSNPNQQQYIQLPPPQQQQPPPQQSIQKLKLILLCHSSAVETSLEENPEAINNINKDKEIYQDEYGKCSTFSKISIATNDRVITLKKLIENRFGIACDDQILVYKDKILNNDLKPLSSYKLRQFSRIHIFDERDIKDSGAMNASDDEIFGVYQQGNFSQSEGQHVKTQQKHQQKQSYNPKNDQRFFEYDDSTIGKKSAKRMTKIDDFTESNSMLSSASENSFTSKGDSCNEVYSKNNRFPSPKTSRSKPHSLQIPIEQQTIKENRKSMVYGTVVAAPVAINPRDTNRSINYYSMSSNRYRKLDEIFDRNMTLDPNYNY